MEIKLYVFIFMIVQGYVCLCDVVPVARLEAIRALKFSRLESFRALQPYGQNGGFKGPKTLRIGELYGP